MQNRAHIARHGVTVEEIVDLGPDGMAKAKAVAKRSGVEVDVLIFQIFKTR